MKYDRYNRHDSCCNMRTAELCCQVVTISLQWVVYLLAATVATTSSETRQSQPVQVGSGQRGGKPFIHCCNPLMSCAQVRGTRTVDGGAEPKGCTALQREVYSRYWSPQKPERRSRRQDKESSLDSLGFRQATERNKFHLY